MKSINTKNYLMLKIYDNSKEIAYAYNLDMIENKGENIQAQNSSSQIQNNNSSNNILFPPYPIPAESLKLEFCVLE